MSTDAPSPSSTKPDPFPQDLKDKGLQRIRHVARGNGVSVKKIRPQQCSGDILHFKAYNVFQIEPVVSHKVVNGKQNGQIVASADDARLKIDNAATSVCHDKKLIKHLESFLSKRADKGFAVSGLTLPLKRYKTSYIVHDTCGPCGGEARITCPECRGQKTAQCKQCHGGQRIPCPQCHGQGMVSGTNGKQQCSRCQGQRKILCTYCKGKGRSSCKTCQKAGSVSCSKCGGTGWLSHISYLTFKSKSRFQYDRSDLPDRAASLIDSLGPEFIKDGHGRVRIQSGDKSDNQGNSDAPSDASEITIEYDAALPWATVEYQLGEQAGISGNLFGYTAAPVHLTPFIETLAGRGIKTLQQAAQTPKGATGNLHKAARYRLVRCAIIAAARLSSTKAKSYLHKIYPFGVNPKTIDILIQQADKTLKNMTQTARFHGLLAGLALNTALYAAYFIGPGRALLQSAVSAHPDLLMTAADGALLLIGGTLSTAAIQTAARRKLQKTLEPFLPEEKHKKISPKAGDSALWGYGLGAVAYIFIAAVTIWTAAPVPAWIKPLAAWLGLI